MPTLTAEQEKAFDRDPDEIKEEIYADWLKEHPGGTRADFEKDYAVVHAVFGP